MENFIVSARKYRPSTFNAVVGQDNIVQTLKNAIKNDSLAQAFLFTGPRGIGKTTCARILAKTINCLNLQPDIEPCNECESCRSFNQLASFNIQELDAASNNSVDDIRTLVDQVRIPPQAGRYKVYIIDEVHMLSSSAFNAFLKTLEEPPAYAKFILATTERHKIIPTILSRCQIYDFKRISVTDIAKHLSWVAGQEQITFEDEALHVIAQKADGALRDALSVFDQIVSFSGRDITYKNVIENLNLLDYEYYFRMIEDVGKHDIPACLIILAEIIDNGFDGQNFINGLGEHIRSLLLSKDRAVANLLEVSEGIRPRYINQAAQFDIVWLVNALDLISRADLNYRAASSKRLHLELLVMQLCETRRIADEKKKPEPIAVTLPEKAEVAKPLSVNPPAVEKGQEPQVKVFSEKPEPQDEIKPADTSVAEPGIVPTGESRKRITIRDLMGSSESSGKDDDNDADEDRGADTESLNPEVIQDLVNRYAETISGDSPSFASAITAKPVKTEPDNRVIITFTNKVAADPVHLKALRGYLREKLGGLYFKLESYIDDTAAPVKVILTAREKYTRMISEHPGIETFVKRLNLELDE